MYLSQNFSAIFLSVGLTSVDVTMSSNIQSSRMQEFVLEAIKKLKKRKIRPDSEQICRMVQRKHESALGTNEALESLVKDNRVDRVPHNSGVTYRVRPKLSNGWRHFDSSTDKESDVSGELDDELESRTYSEETTGGRTSREHVFPETEESLRSASTNTSPPTPDTPAEKPAKRKKKKKVICFTGCRREF